ncbi:MAG: DUF4340 domain-containing protein [Candidatus Krumholzibacteriia bacterium]
MSFKAMTWILLAALVAIVGYFFLIDEKNRVRSVAERKLSAKLFRYRPEDVERFILINPKGERIEVARSGGGWKVVSPVEAPGSGLEISSFIAQIVPGRRSSELENVRNFADYGLAQPFATLIICRAGGAAPDTLLVGDKTPAGSNCYLRLGSSRSVLLSSEVTRNVMNKGLFHLRDKNFLPEGHQSIDALEIRAGSKRTLLVKEKGYWWFTAPHVRANRLTIESYLSRLTDAVIHEFVREDTKELAPYGLESPAGELVLAKGKGTVTIAFGNKKDYLVNVVRTGLDKVVAIEAAFLAPFDWSTGNLRAMDFAFIDKDSVQSLKYETPDTSIVIERAGTSWRAPEREQLSIRPPEVNALIRKLNSVSFERILKEPLPVDARLERFALRMILADARGNVIDRIAIAAQGDGSEIGSSTSANALGSLPRGTAAGIDAIFKRIGAK